ncbi:hypothetical protein [Pseudomonas paralcaligenes]|uniref:hypothetical protein n=1 Tax=Pseudomonas paralcaligenes TaxID=2772558 RepID=UPI0021CE2507|nr:hypothetical protein [Pseudomonas paralcaligenes]
MPIDLIAALRGEDGDLFVKDAADMLERQQKLLDKDAAVAGHMQAIVDGLRTQLEALRAAAVNAIERAAVFDDGTDGADAESARSVVAILRGALAPQPADATDAARAGRQQDEREAVELQRILFAHYREVRPLDAGLFGWAAVALARQGVPQTPVDDLLLELEGMRSSLETARHNWRGFEDRCGDLQVENGKLRDELQALKAQEPVAWARRADLDDPSDCLFVSRYQYLATDYSVALYTATPPAAQDVSEQWANGLPPAGAQCEARIPHHTSNGRQMLWSEVEVIGHAIIQGAVYSWVKEPGPDGAQYAPMMLSFRQAQQQERQP